MARPRTDGYPHMDYTPEVGQAICELIATNGLSIKNLCLAYPEIMPPKPTIYMWVMRHPEFEELFRIAHERQAELWVQDALDVADDVPERMIDDEAVQMDTQAAVGRAKLRVDTRLRAAGLMNRRRYGQRVSVAGGEPGDGADGGYIANGGRRVDRDRRGCLIGDVDVSLGVPRGEHCQRR